MEKEKIHGNKSRKLTEEHKRKIAESRMGEKH